MKFSEMPYARPDLDELKQQLQALPDQLKSAPDYASAHEAFLAQQKLSTHIDTLAIRSRFCHRIGSDIESDDNCIGSRSKCHVGFVDCTNTAVDDFDHDLLVGQLCQ